MSRYGSRRGLGAIIAWALLIGGPALGAITTRISVSSSGQEANDSSTGMPQVSADGRFVVFASYAGNLVDFDTNGTRDVFLHDNQTGETTCISVDPAGRPGNGYSGAEFLSSDGRYVLFASQATNLVLNDTNGYRDVFVFDRQTGEMTRVSVSSAGVQGNNSSDAPSISDDGRYVAFSSYAKNLDPGYPQGGASVSNVFLHDRATGQTTWISQGTDGQGTGAFAPRISGDGSAVAFTSSQGNVVPGDTNSLSDVFVYDVNADQITRVSVSSTGQEGNGTSGSSSWPPSISADGRLVVFDSYASNLVSDDANGEQDAFLHDRATGETSRVSVGSQGEEANEYSTRPSISADGRYVAFESLATNLIPGGHYLYVDIYLRDLAAGTNEVISYPWLGTNTNAYSSGASASSDGRFVTFYSAATNLVAVDTNGEPDVFLRDRGGDAPGILRIVHVDRDAPLGGDGQSWDSAYDDLQTALTRSAAGDQIRVAEGIYTPAGPDGPRIATFPLRDHVELRGGYAGLGAFDPDERDLDLFETVLSGDLNGDDGTPGFSDCCSDRAGAKGCDDPSCEAAVCAVEPTCCDNFWTATCADLAEDLCPDACGFNNDNSFHVVISIDNPRTTVLDGFTIRGGAADGSGVSPDTFVYSRGGGMYAMRSRAMVANCRFVHNWSFGAGGAVFNGDESDTLVVDSSFTANASGASGGAMANENRPAIRRCTFDGNEAFGTGGAIQNLSGSEPTITECDFSGNAATAWGGAVEHEGDEWKLTDCTFAGNYSDYQGGALSLYSTSAPAVTRCTFIDNSTQYDGGAVFMAYGTPRIVGCTFLGNDCSRFGGAVYVSSPSSPTVLNCVFRRNNAGFGGGGLYQRSSTSMVIVANSTFSSNTAGAYGGGAYNYSATAMTIGNSVFWGNLADVGTTEAEQIYDYVSPARVTHSCIQGLNTFANQEGNIGDNPDFRDPNGPDHVAGTMDDDVRLAAGSPCIDAGSNGAVPPDSLDLNSNGNFTEPTPIDFDGYARFADDPDTPDCPQPGADCGSPPIVDMGAFEYHRHGDLDGDGDADREDYVIFAECLTGPQTFSAADSDWDGDVDLSDFAAWLACLAGPGVPVAGGCQEGDFDSDADADLRDYAFVQAAFTGPQEPLSADCKPADLDSDLDVDLADFASFEEAVNGQ